MSICVSNQDGLDKYFPRAYTKILINGNPAIIANRTYVDYPLCEESSRYSFIFSNETNLSGCEAYQCYMQGFRYSWALSMSGDYYNVFNDYNDIKILHTIKLNNNIKIL